MTCRHATDCQPCQQCADEAPEPILPRCDVVLTDGVFPWATVTVEDGCIVEVNEGRAPLYQPDSCCALPGEGGSNGDGLDGDRGPPGQAATIQVGSVSGSAPGSPPTVVNVGTSSNAILDFTIPRGEPGEDAAGAGGASSTLGGITLTEGLIQEPLPVMWPPVLELRVTPSNVAGIVLEATKDPADGLVTLGINLDAYVANVQATFEQQQEQIVDLETRLAELTARFDACLACNP